MEASANPSDAPKVGGFCDDLLRWVDRYRFWLIGGVVALYLLGLNGHWRIGPDSALYAELARNVVEGRGYEFHGVHHNLVYPGFPYILAGVFRLFGDGSWWAVNTVMLATGLGVLALTYRLFRLHVARPTAVMMVAIVGVCETVFRYAFQPLTDMPFLLGIMGVLAGYEGLMQGRERGGRPWLDGSLLVGGMLLMTFTRPVMIAMHGAILAAAVIGVAIGPRRLVRAGVAAASVGALALFHVLDPRRPGVLIEAAAGEAGRQTRSYESILGNQFERLGHTVTTALTDRLPELTWNAQLADAMLGIELAWGPINLLFAVIVVVLTVGLIRRRSMWGWLALAMLVQVAVFPARPRYLLPLMPLFLFAAWVGLRWLSARLPERWQAVCLALFVLLVGPNLVLSARIVVHQRLPDFYEHYHSGRYVPILRMAEMIRSHVPEGAVVLSDRQRSLTYLSGRRVLNPRKAFAGIDHARVIDWLGQQDRLFVVWPGDGEGLSDAAKELLDDPAIRLHEPLAEVEHRWWRAKLHRASITPEDRRGSP